MRLISLNIWEGKKEKELVKFLKDKINNTDIFCFQEVSGFFQHLTELLQNYYGYLTTQKRIDVGTKSLCTFVNNKHNWQVHDISENMQLILAGNVTIMNIHGIWFDGDKIDHPETMQQSKNIIEKKPDIIVGDFNLFPNTESIAMFKKKGYRNMIEEYKIKSTRPKSWPFPVPFADYAFVSKNILVENFYVLEDEVSDHLPMVLEYEINR